LTVRLSDVVGAACLKFHTDAGLLRLLFMPLVCDRSHVRAIPLRERFRACLARR
jgi:hypothetical protein